MRYWISRSEGNVEGPFEEAKLRDMFAEGSITLVTQVCAEETENWIALGSVQGFAVPGRSNTAGTVAIQISNYTFGKAFGLGWKFFTTRYGIVLGVTLFAILASLIPTLCTTPLNIAFAGTSQGGGPGGDQVALQFLGGCFSSAWSFLVATPISIGAVWVIVRIARGHADASFSDIWAPFKRYGWFLVMELLLGACLLGIFTIAGLAGGIPGVLVGLVVGFYVESGVAGVVAGIVVGFAIFFPLVFYFSVRIMPAYILIIDDEARFPNAIESLAMSWKVTSKHAWSLVGLMIVLSLITLASVTCCFFPFLFFGEPLGLAVMAAAYCLLVPGIGLAGTRCSACGYVMAPGSSGNCPECGAKWDGPITA